MTQENSYKSMFVPEPVQPKVRAASYTDSWLDSLAGLPDAIHWHGVDVMRVATPHATVPFKEEWVRKTRFIVLAPHCRRCSPSMLNFLILYIFYETFFPKGDLE